MITELGETHGSRAFRPLVSRPGGFAIWSLCNHVWFSAQAGIDVLDPERRFLTKADLEDVPTGSIAVWEPHYGDRHQGDVSLADVEDLSGYRVLRRFAEPSTEFFAVALEKLEGSRSRSYPASKRYHTV